MSELTKFNPQDIMQGVRDKIKASFVELIPEEHWNQMVQTEVDSFFQKNIKLDQYDSRNRYVSSFEMMLNAELKKFAEEKIKEYLNGPEFQQEWGNHGGPKVSAGLSKIIVENSGAILTEMIGGILQMKLQQARY